MSAGKAIKGIITVFACKCPGTLWEAATRIMLYRQIDLYPHKIKRAVIGSQRVWLQMLGCLLVSLVGSFDKVHEKNADEEADPKEWVEHQRSSCQLK